MTSIFPESEKFLNIAALNYFMDLIVTFEMPNAYRAITIKVSS
jgi:hypothetical protein